MVIYMRGKNKKICPPYILVNKKKYFDHLKSPNINYIDSNFVIKNQN